MDFCPEHHQTIPANACKSKCLTGVYVLRWSLVMSQKSGFKHLRFKHLPNDQTSRGKQDFICNKSKANHTWTASTWNAWPGISQSSLLASEHPSLCPFQGCWKRFGKKWQYYCVWISWKEKLSTNWKVGVWILNWSHAKCRWTRHWLPLEAVSSMCSCPQGDQ